MIESSSSALAKKAADTMHKLEQKKNVKEIGRSPIGPTIPQSTKYSSPNTISADSNINPNSIDPLLESRNAARAELNGVRTVVRYVTNFVVIAALIVGIGLAAMVNRPATVAQPENTFPNWSQHVEPLTKWNSDRTLKQVRRINSGGVIQYLSSIELNDADRDDTTSQEVIAALQSNDPAKVINVIEKAQNVAIADAPAVATIQPEAVTVPETILPTVTTKLSEGLKQELLQGDASFYHVYLYDSCDEDGDIVELIVDGVPFAVVPITHRGSTLSVPVSSTRSTAIQIRGIRDGTGGITVACRTSTGEYFMQVLREGEIQAISIVPSK